MGTLLTVMLIAAGQFEKQRTTSQTKLKGVTKANELMAEFFALGFPGLPSHGEIPSDQGWTWELAGRPDPRFPEQISKITLKIFHHAKQPNPIAMIEAIVANRHLGGRRP